MLETSLCLAIHLLVQSLAQQDWSQPFSLLWVCLMLTTSVAGSGYCHWTQFWPWLAGFPFQPDLRLIITGTTYLPIQLADTPDNCGPALFFLDGFCGTSPAQQQDHDHSLMPSLAPSLPCLPGLPAPAASWHASLHRMLSLNADVVGVTVMMFLTTNCSSKSQTKGIQISSNVRLSYPKMPVCSRPTGA